MSKLRQHTSVMLVSAENLSIPELQSKIRRLCKEIEESPLEAIIEDIQYPTRNGSMFVSITYSYFSKS